MKTRNREKESRESIALMLLILLLGFICIILTSGWALRFKPNWRLPANMGSNLNPDSDFHTGVPDSFFEPLDPAILTNPAWFDVFLTPDAPYATHPPLPTSTRTPSPTNTAITTNTSLPVITSSPTNTPLPTNTVIFYPPFTSTPKPPRPPRDTPTATSVPPTSADLQVTKTDGVVSYLPGGTLTYTITVTNSGPSDVVGAVVTDNFPAQIASATWTCTPSGGASCAANGTGSINEAVNLPVSSTVTYTVNVTISAAATGDLANTASASVPPGYADPAPGNDSATDTDVQLFIPSADLAITKDDFVTTYTPGGAPLVYTITVINNSGSDVVGAVVTDNLPVGDQIVSWDWVCTSQTGGASGCDGVVGSNSNFTDIVDLPVGGMIVYTVTANIDPAATGDLTNRAIVGFAFDDPMPGNNTAIDTDTYVP